MKKKINKITMMLTATAMFLSTFFLSLEQDVNGKWNLSVNKGISQTGTGGGETGGGEINANWIRTDKDCVYSFTGKAGAKITIFGGTIITIGADGTATYIIGDGKTECELGGKQQCTARYCENLW